MLNNYLNVFSSQRVYDRDQNFIDITNYVKGVSINSNWDIIRYIVPLLVNGIEIYHYHATPLGQHEDYLIQNLTDTIIPKEYIDNKIAIIEIHSASSSPDVCKQYAKRLGKEYKDITTSELKKLFIDHYKNNNRIDKKESDNDLEFYLFQVPKNNIIIKLTNYAAKTSNEIKYPETCIMLGLIPVFFKKEFKSVFTKDEIKYFQTLTDQVSRTANSNITRALETLISLDKYISFRKQRQEEELLKAFKYIKTERMRRSLKDNEALYNDTYSRLRTVLSERTKLEQQILFEEANPASRDIVDYILSNKYIVDFSLQGTILVVEVVVPMNLYDPEHMELSLKSRTSFGARVLKNIYLENKGEIYVGSIISLDLISNNFSIRSFESDKCKLNNCYQNPHHAGYSCFGTWANEITKALRTNMYEAAIEYAIASVKNINATDGTVMSYLVQHIKDNETNYTCIRYEDKMYTFKEYMKVIDPPKEEVKVEEAQVVQATTDPFVAEDLLGEELTF